MQMRSLVLATCLTVLVGGLSLAQQSGQDGVKPRRPADNTVHIPDAPDFRHPSGVQVFSDNAYALTLGQMRFDMADGLPPVDERFLLSSPDDRGNNLRLVQFSGPTQQRWLDQLKDQGLDIVQYIHPHAYVTWGSMPANREALPQQVRATADFIPAFRVLPWYHNLADTPIQMRAMLYRGADLDQTVAELRALGAIIDGRRKMDQTFDIVGFTLNGTLIADAASIAGVYSVKPVPTDGGLRGEMSNQINAGNYDGSNQALLSPSYQDWLAGIGLDGSGVIIANVDSGVEETHPDLVGRMLPCVGDTCNSTPSGHGTHTAGIMAGDAASGTVDSLGFLRGLGVAPGANLVAQEYSPTFTQAGGMLKLMTQSYNNGASLSGNSWGPAGSPQGYDDDTRQVDVGVRDTDPDTPGDQPLTYVLSFMNGGGGTSTQGSPDEGKNLFNIGSTKMQTGSGAQILDIDDISGNSAHGPALDGRTIPHMVAPGCDVDSTLTSGGYGLLCGTSMASPHVSGAVALFIEHYRNLTGARGSVADPSPALIKAAFLPVAHDLEGFDDADGNPVTARFNDTQGWGRMNLPAVLDIDPDGVRYFDNPVVFDNTGEEWTTSLTPLDPSQPVRIMLVWTDAPGHGLGGSTPAWNNDLDLEVVADGTTYLGNNFGAGGWSVGGGSADAINNTEGVFLGPTAPAAITVTVRATGINFNGLPNEGDETDQDFALVAYNAAVEPGFALSASETSHVDCIPGTHMFTINVAQILGFSDSIILDATSASGDLTVGTSVPNIVAPGSFDVNVSYPGAGAAGEHIINVTATSGSIVRNLALSLALSDSIPAAPTPLGPAHNATDVALLPTLTWTATGDATTEYVVEVATDIDFNNIVFSTTTSDTSVAIAPALDYDTPYFWQVRGQNICGVGLASVVFSFTTGTQPRFLIVDDDDNSPDVAATYAALLSSLGHDFATWDTNNSDTEPDAATLSQYDFVIWFTGDEFGGAAGPGSTGETALASYLDDAGCLFMSSQDYHWDRGLTSFMTDYLGVGSVTNDQAQTSATGADIYSGIGTVSLTYPFSNYSDTLVVAESASTAFSGNQGLAGVNVDGGNYRSTFIVFPLEAVSSSADQEAILGTFIEWCNDLFEACPGDADGSGTVDVNDLIQVILNWGTTNAAIDLDDSGTVDVGDVIQVILNWSQTC